jgi:predicted metalloprotease
MKWIGNRKSDNLEDRRGMSSGGKAVVGGGAMFGLNTIKNI